MYQEARPPPHTHTHSREQPPIPPPCKQFGYRRGVQPRDPPVVIEAWFSGIAEQISQPAVVGVDIWVDFRFARGSFFFFLCSAHGTRGLTTTLAH